MKKTLSTLALALFLSSSLFAQGLKTPQASTTQTIKQDFALSSIEINYSRPSMKGRTIFGDLVPFGKPWRTGANNATKITFGEDVKVEGNDVKAGTYGLYSVPNKDSWEIMLYKDLTLGGNVAEYKKEDEVLRFTVKPSALTEKVETFEINVGDITSTSANVELSWEKTRVAFKVTADIDSKIMKTIESTVIKDNKPYFQAATYYYDNDKDLKQALEWVDKAFAANPKAYWIAMLKAKIQFKMKDMKGATATAETAKALATADQDDAYVKQAEKLIADAKK